MFTVVRCLCIFMICLYGINAESVGSKNPTALSELSESFQNLAEKVSPAVVQVFSTGFGSSPATSVSEGTLLTRQRTSGSGVIVDPEGYIVTNAHVVEGAQSLQVLLAWNDKSAERKSILKPKGTFVPAKLVGTDSETDLAVLKVELKGHSFLALANSDELRPGQLVFAFGSPFGLENSVSMGVVSSVARQLRTEDPMIYIQTDTPINPGNSGGPLVNIRGEVVGINTSILSLSGGNEGIGFAAPSNIVRNVYQQLRKSGRVHRGQIGVSVQTITPAMAAGLSLSQDWGAIVSDVFPKSPAEQAGLKIGDVILSLDGKTIENGRQFEVNLYRRAEGEALSLEILRGKETVNIQVIVIARQDETPRLAGMVTPQENVIPRLGIVCLELTDRIAQLFPSLRKQYGVVIAAHISDPPYWANQFVPGDIVHAVNGKFITNISELRSTIQSFKKGDPVVLQLERSGKLLYVTIEIE